MITEHADVIFVGEPAVFVLSIEGDLVAHPDVQLDEVGGLRTNDIGDPVADCAEEAGLDDLLVGLR